MGRANAAAAQAAGVTAFSTASLPLPTSLARSFRRTALPAAPQLPSFTSSMITQVIGFTTSPRPSASTTASVTSSIMRSFFSWLSEPSGTRMFTSGMLWSSYGLGCKSRRTLTGSIPWARALPRGGPAQLLDRPNAVGARRALDAAGDPRGVPGGQALRTDAVGSGDRPQHALRPPGHAGGRGDPRAARLPGAPGPPRIPPFSEGPRSLSGAGQPDALGRPLQRRAGGA